MTKIDRRFNKTRLILVDTSVTVKNFIRDPEKPLMEKPFMRIEGRAKIKFSNDSP
jgi:hypothetical protein